MDRGILSKISPTLATSATSAGTVGGGPYALVPSVISTTSATFAISATSGGGGWALQCHERNLCDVRDLRDRRDPRNLLGPSYNVLHACMPAKFPFSPSFDNGGPTTIKLCVSEPVWSATTHYNDSNVSNGVICMFQISFGDELLQL